MERSLSHSLRFQPYWIGFWIAALLSAAKILQHLQFGTRAYDLGIQGSVAWNTAHGHWFYDSVHLQGNYLGDHFSPFYLLISWPLRVWESPIFLLILQSVGIGLAAIALYRLAYRKFESAILATGFCLLFFLNSYLHRVSAYDFHPIALAIPIFLWMLDCVELGRRKGAFLLVLLAFTIEETLIPPAVGVGVYLACFHPHWRRFGLFLAIGAVGYFLLTVKVFLPYFLGEDRLTHIGRYSNLGGNSFEEIARAVLSNPLILLKAMLTPLEKIPALLKLFGSVAFLPLLAPKRLFLLAPGVLLFIIGNYEHQWRYHFQYSAILLPFLFYAALEGWNRIVRLMGHFASIRTIPWRKSVGMGISGFAILIIFALHRPSYFAFRSFEELKPIYAMMERIPKRASVCTNTHFLPHLIDRHQIHQLDSRCEAQYFLLHSDVKKIPTVWPASEEEYQKRFDQIKNSDRYRILEQWQGIYLFEKK